MKLLVRNTLLHILYSIQEATTQQICVIDINKSLMCSTNVCVFGVLRRFQHCTGHITTGSWKGRGNQYIEFARVVYCKLPTNGKQLPDFPLKAMTGIDPRPQRWEARVLPLCHRGPLAQMLQNVLLKD